MRRNSGQITDLEARIVRAERLLASFFVTDRAELLGARAERHELGWHRNFQSRASVGKQEREAQKK